MGGGVNQMLQVNIADGHIQEKWADLRVFVTLRDPPVLYQFEEAVY